MWIQLAILVVSMIISYATQSRAAAAKRAAFEDFEFPQAEEGTPQAVIFGDVWTEDWMVLGVGNYRTTPIRK